MTFKALGIGICAIKGAFWFEIQIGKLQLNQDFGKSLVLYLPRPGKKSGFMMKTTDSDGYYSV